MEAKTTVVAFADLADEARRERVADALREAFGRDFERQGVAGDRVAFFLAQNFQAHNALLTLWEGDDLLATAAYVKSGDDLFLCNVLALPAHRGRGHARRMVREAERAAAAAHGSRAPLRLWCSKPLVPFYEALGYAWTQRSRIARDEFVEVMAKRLD